MNKVTMRLLLIVLIALTFSACGSSNPISAPSGSAITVNPSSLDFTALASAGSDTSTRSTQSSNFVISVADSAGLPLNNTKVNIWFSTSTDYVQFYDGNTPMGTSFSATTDSFGTYTLRFDYEVGAGINYSGSIELSSGTAYQTVAISVH